MRHLIVLIFFVVFAVGCTHENDFPEKNFPVVLTSQVELNGEQLIFTSAIEALEGEALDHGFIISRTVRSFPITWDHKISLGPISSPGNFTAENDYNLVDNRWYILKSFIITDNSHVYGIPIAFSVKAGKLQTAI
jgi:hypothetical protein